MQPPSVEEQKYEPLFDFPCSYAYRRFEAELNGEYLPPLEPLADDILPEPQGEVRSLTRREWDAISQLKAQILHLERKLNEHLDAQKRKKHKPKGVVPL